MHGTINIVDRELQRQYHWQPIIIVHVWAASSSKVRTYVWIWIYYRGVGDADSSFPIHSSGFSP